MHKPLGYTFFPRWIEERAIFIYLAILLTSALLFTGYTMHWFFLIAGIVEVFAFFYFSNLLTKEWNTASLSNQTFGKRLFGTSLSIRLAFVFFSYWFYIQLTETPFEFHAADSIFYHYSAVYGAQLLRDGSVPEFWTKFNEQLKMDISDVGYATYLSFIYYVTFDSILVVRIIKAFLSAATVWLIYRLAARNFEEHIARVSGVFCMLMPNLIYYCGVQLKEVEMVFLTVLLVEQTDQMLRSPKFTIWKLFPILLIGAALFTIRTALAVVVILALLFTVVMASDKVMNWAKRTIVGLLAVTLIGITIGNRICENAKDLVETVKSDEQKSNMEWRSKRNNGNKFAEYAGAAVFAPLIFTIPFPTVVDIPEQENHQFINGGNYVKNILSFFVIIAIVSLLFSGDWRKYAMPLSFMMGYLVVLTFSSFPHSERFHQPALPFELMFAAYALPLLERKHKRWFNYWLIAMFVAAVAWQWFKLAGRNMI